jgi:hypothetical protein
MWGTRLGCPPPRHQDVQVAIERILFLNRRTCQLRLNILRNWVSSTASGSAAPAEVQDSGGGFSDSAEPAFRLLRMGAPFPPSAPTATSSCD